jgi:hypothetical protein
MKDFAQSFAILSSLLVASCGQQPGVDVKYDPNANYLPSDTVSFVQSTPEDQSLEVPLDSTIEIKFSGRVQVGSISDGTQIRVEDDMGSRLPGVFSFNAAQDTLSWYPYYGGRRLAFNNFTHYRVLLQMIQDVQGRVIAPWSFDIYTKKDITSSGKFKIVYLGKQRNDDGTVGDSYDKILGPTQAIEVQFSEPLFENREMCDQRWSDAFQILDVGLGSIAGQGGQVCLRCRYYPGGNICDTLRLTPDIKNPWKTSSAVSVKIKSSPLLKGISGEPLLSEQTKEFFVLPNVSNLIGDFFK